MLKFNEFSIIVISFSFFCKIAFNSIPPLFTSSVQAFKCSTQNRWIVFLFKERSISLLILTGGNVGKPGAEKPEGILRLSFYLY